MEVGALAEEIQNRYLRNTNPQLYMDTGNRFDILWSHVSDYKD
jgi:hypothetical protein